MSAEYNFRFRIDWNVPRFDLDLTAGYIGQVKVLGYPVVGSPTQAQIDAAVAAYIEAHPGSLSPLSPAVKAALLQIAEKVAYIDEHGEDYYDALDAALNAKALLQITAVYTQSGTVYDTDTLDSLKSDLVVTAYYDDGTTADVTSACTLSGTLAEGTSTITATYSGKTATFEVTVTEYIPEGWLYHFNGDLVSSGTKDFGWTGTANYSTGYDGTGESYWHKMGTEGTSSTDPLGIKATGLTDVPDYSGDFTISYWFKATTALRGHPFVQMKCLRTSGSATTQIGTSPANIKSGYTVTLTGTQNTHASVSTIFSSQKLNIRLTSNNASYGGIYVVTLPSSVDTTAWHHYALTRSGSTVRFFVDGEIIFTTTISVALDSPDQICIGNNFATTAVGSTDLVAGSYGDIVDDLYVASTCKWTSAFDPTSIVY